MVKKGGVGEMCSLLLLVAQEEQLKVAESGSRQLKQTAPAQASEVGMCPSLSRSALMCGPVGSSTSGMLPMAPTDAKQIKAQRWPAQMCSLHAFVETGSQGTA